MSLLHHLAVLMQLFDTAKCQLMHLWSHSYNWPVVVNPSMIKEKHTISGFVSILGDSRLLYFLINKYGTKPLQHFPGKLFCSLTIYFMVLQNSH